MSGLLFDLGGTFLRSGIAGEDGFISHRRKTRICSVVHGLDPTEIWDRILASVLDYEKECGSHLRPGAPVILSFPGPIGRNCSVLQAPTVAGSGETGFDLPSAIRAATGRQVFILNDVSAAAWKIAETARVQRFAVITVSSGIGSKIYDRCHASGVLAQPPYAGEIGHVVVDDSADAPVCDCGGRGHLGAIASARGIERIVRVRARADYPAFSRSLLFTRFGASAADLTNESHIVPALRARDPWTSSIVYECTRHLVRSLLTVTMAAGLEKVYIIGGFPNALGSRYLEIIRSLAQELSKYQIAAEYLDEFFKGVVTDQETCLEGCAAYLRAMAGGR